MNIVCRHLWFIITNSENAVSQSEHEVNTVCYPYQTRERAREFLLLFGWEKELVCADWTEQLARVLWELSTLCCIEWFTIYLEAFAVVPIVFQLCSILQKVCLRMFFSPKNKIRVVRCRYWVKTIPMWQNSWTIWPCYVKTKENMTRYAELHPFWKDAVLRPWQTRTHCCGHIVADTNVSPFARARNIRCGHKFCVRDKKCFWFCSETFCVRNKCFPVCAAQETSWATR